MNNNPPVSFQEMAQRARNAASGGYPYTIRGSDLDKNFVFATPKFFDEHFKLSTDSGNGGHQQRVVEIRNPLPLGENSGGMLYWQNDTWSIAPTPASGSWLYWTGEDFSPTPAPANDGIFYVWDNTEKEWRFIPTPTADGQMLQWDNTEKEWRFIGKPTRDGQLLKWNDTSKTWAPFSGGQEGAFPQWDETNGWESRGSGSVRGQLLRWDNDSKNWGPASGVPGSLMQWDEVDGWQAAGTGSATSQLLRFNNDTKKWGPFSAPPATGKYVLGSVDGALTWIATEEC